MTSHLAGHRLNGLVLTAVLTLVLQHQPHGPLLHFRRKLRWSRHAPILAGFGAPGKPGAIHTVSLQKSLPEGAQHWGVARKVLNIFLRDALYTVYLREAFHLAEAERHFELPLDSVTGRQLCAAVGEQLPRWSGVRHLTAELSERYQRHAALVADAHGTYRVHLDAYWWSVSRDAPMQ
jgi:hypothetical protein